MDFSPSCVEAQPLVDFVLATEKMDGQCQCPTADQEHEGAYKK